MSWGTTEESGTVLLAINLPLATEKHFLDTPLLLSLLFWLNSLSSFSLSLNDRCSSLLNHLWDPSLKSHPSTSMSAFYQEAQILAVFLIYFPSLGTEINNFFSSAHKCTDHWRAHRLYFGKNGTQDFSLSSVKIKLNKIWEVYTDQDDNILTWIVIIKNA